MWHDMDSIRLVLKVLQFLLQLYSLSIVGVTSELKCIVETNLEAIPLQAIVALNSQLYVQSTSVIEMVVVYVGVVCITRVLKEGLDWATDKRLRIITNVNNYATKIKE